MSAAQCKVSQVGINILDVEHYRNMCYEIIVTLSQTNKTIMLMAVISRCHEHTSLISTLR